MLKGSPYFICVSYSETCSLYRSTYFLYRRGKKSFYFPFQRNIVVYQRNIIALGNYHYQSSVVSAFSEMPIISDKESYKLLADIQKHFADQNGGKPLPWNEVCSIIRQNIHKPEFAELLNFVTKDKFNRILAAIDNKLLSIEESSTSPAKMLTQVLDNKSFQNQIMEIVGEITNTDYNNFGKIIRAAAGIMPAPIKEQLELVKNN